MIKHHNFKIFVDFDGTITREDVGASFFTEFGDNNAVFAIIGDIMNKTISGREGWDKLFATLRKVSREEYSNFVHKFEIDSSFHQFIGMCEENNFEVTILSDGFDLYLEKILKREGLERLKFFSNHLVQNEEGNFTYSFPFTDEECDRCANCKRNHLINSTSDDDFTVFIGNGISDQCPAQYCDFIFAKDSLLKFCEKERISYYPYSNFNQVKDILLTLASKKNLKKRHQAELKRRSVYLQG